MMEQNLLLSRLGWVALGALGVGLALSACDGGGDGGGDPSGTTTTTGTGGSTTTGTLTGSGGAGGAGGSGGSGTGGSMMVVCDPPVGQVPPLQLTMVANGLDRPVFVTGDPSDQNRLFVVEQTGAVRIVDAAAGMVLQAPFLDVSSLIPQPGGADEYGLLGMAVHPDYANNGRVFIYYTQDSDNAFVVAEFTRSQGNPDVAEPTGNVIFSIPEGANHPHYGNHNGGMLAFGPDGYLYIGVGDGGSSGDPNGNGQDINKREGKILRIDVNNPTVAPPGNVPGGDPFIWDYGIRNPWRFSFDSCTGDLYIGDVGQGSREEINVEPAGQGNRNYGWNTMEGTLCYNPPQGCDMTGLTLPVRDYSHQTGDAESINGGYVYRGNLIPALRGTYFFADYGRGWVRTFVWQNGTVGEENDLTADLQAGNLAAMVSFGQDAAGELYIVDLGASANAGGIYRIEPEP